MEWTIEYWDEPEILHIKTHGILTASNANQMLAEIVEAMSRYQCTKQIVDHSDTDMTLSVTEYYQRPKINEQIGISRSWKIAMVFKTLDDKSQFMETVFRNRGYKFLQFSSLEEAKSWIENV